MLYRLFLAVVCLVSFMGVIYSEESLLQEDNNKNAEPTLDTASSEQSLGGLARRLPQYFWRLGQTLNRGLMRPSHMKQMTKNSSEFQRGHRPKHRVKNHLKFVLKIKQYERLIAVLFRTITRRESSLVTPRRGYDDADDTTIHTARVYSSVSGVSLGTRVKCGVQKELVTLLFESMLYTIVESWTPIVEHKPDDIADLEMEALLKSLDKDKKKKTPTVGKAPKVKKSRSKQDLYDIPQSPTLSQSMFQSWWSSPDERAIILFRNGNLYEGSISMKCMNGNGRYQWADGTIYLGQFKENEIQGKGLIQWKDDTWYEGEFVNNLRHGHGLYVNSRQQQCYSGDWYCGTKHGLGVIHFSETFKNSYDGEWDCNVRHGCAIREYCPISGYKGEFNKYIRCGEGLMIWPNHDVYKGQWDNGVMYGLGIYIWESRYNSTLSLSSLNIYRGYWKHGQRYGYGMLDLGFGGAFYKGEFIYNKKHGQGKFVTNNGLMLQNKNLFVDDNFGIPATDEVRDTPLYLQKRPASFEPTHFDICDDKVGLLYHIQQALCDVDDLKEDKIIIINDYFLNNRINAQMSVLSLKSEYRGMITSLIDFEEISLRKALECYRYKLTNIYHMYATICNKNGIEFSPVLIRLFLWQLYFDCKIQEKDLSLVEIDKMYHGNPEWLSRNPHDPFEKIYFWQFMHSLITVAKRLYAKKSLPSKKPDTIVAKAFRTFMDIDILPNIGQRRGKLPNGYGEVLPLNALYKLYRTLGEPLTVRTFLCAVRYPGHWSETPKPIIDEEYFPCGRNTYVIGDGVNYIVDECPNSYEYTEIEDLKLFNFGNLSSSRIIKIIFGNIFPQIFQKDKIIDLDIKMTFYEFFEAFVTSAEESIRIKEEEIRWREQFVIENETQSNRSSPGRLTKGK